jgi:hypothetical protein
LSKDVGDEFQGAETILVIVGDLLEEYPYQKSTAIQVCIFNKKDFL